MSTTRAQRIEQYTRIAELYKQGLSDSKIAEAVGCSRLTVFSWRQRNGKPTNNPKHTQPVKKNPAEKRVAHNKKVDDDRARELYDSGLDDQEIGSILGLSPSTISAWRRRHNLISQRKISQEVINPEAKKLSAANALARARGMTYGEYMALQYAANHT